MLGFAAITAAATVLAINNMFARWWQPVQWSVYTWIEQTTAKNPDFHPKDTTLVAAAVDPHTPWPSPRFAKEVDSKT